MKQLSTLRTTGLCVLALAAAACGGPSRDAVWTSGEGLLRYVPADSPYLLAKVAPPPDDFGDRFEANLEAMLAAYRQVIHGTQSEAEAGEGDEQRAEMLAAVDELLSVEGLHEAGLTRDSTMVFYGVGLLPVLRVTLSEGHAFEEAVMRIESAAGAELLEASLDGQPYRYIDLDEARLVMRLDEREAAFSMVPKGLSEDRLRSVLGLRPPDQSIASSAALHDLAERYGFLPYYVGFLDVDRIAATFLEDPTGINAELLDLAEYDASSLSDVCRAELRAMANIVPRAVVGYTALSAESLRTNTVFELREDIATGLAGVSAPVPGLSMSHDGLFAYGMGFDLAAARDFYTSRVEAVASDPYECELFAEMQSTTVESRQALNRIPQLAYGFRGFLAVVDDAGEIGLTADQVPTDIDARVLIATDNAPALVGLAALVSPDLAALNLQPNGEPVRVDVPQQAGVPIETAYVALTQDTIALAVGDEAESRLTAMMNAPPSDQSTFLTFEMDMTRYYELIDESLSQAAADRPGAAQINETLMQALRGTGGRSRIDVRFTERGIEIPASATLAE